MGLYEYLTEYFDKKGYEYSVLDSKHYGLPFETEDYVTPEGIASFIKALRLPFRIRDYQLKGVYEAIKHNRKAYYYPPRGQENP